MKLTSIPEFVNRRWPEKVQVRLNAQRALCELASESSVLVELCGWLAAELDYSFAGLIVEEQQSEWELRYVFYRDRDAGWVHVLVHQALANATFPSLSARIHAADWHEREAEDLFGLVFAGHPRLGDFVLHDDRWQENLEPMRHGFDGHKPVVHREPDLDWRPRRIVEDPGAFAMPIGPIYSGVTESAHFLLETVGEDVIRTIPRLFYKYRAIEKIAEGRSVEDALLLAERFAATTAFAHALAFCRSAESICGVEVPPRAKTLRVLLAELERFRHHVGAIQEICESTALVVANNQAAMLEEELLRVSCAFTGHRYLFGLAVCGGLARPFEDTACREVVAQARGILQRLDELETLLDGSSSFLDRLEEVGSVSEQEASLYGLVGPVARASGLARDLRKAQPYSGYDAFSFEVPCAHEGDGYARLRVLFAEARQSVKLMEQAAAALPRGPIQVPKMEIRPGAALGWSEAPRGATFDWLRIGEDGRVARYRLITPSFTNWHGFHLAAEEFAFQDFPIILASFDLSVAENDR
jgi:Ni,Fe-hydrogenase III large subunit/Ni,Fe-hydrogenase III component G